MFSVVGLKTILFIIKSTHMYIYEKITRSIILGQNTSSVAVYINSCLWLIIISFPVVDNVNFIKQI